MAEDRWSSVVEGLTADGFAVYWPQRDTDQTDPIGFAICAQNAEAIAAADVVHVIWDGLSQGALFDLGVAFALGKKVVALDLPPGTSGKSFQNMVHYWEENGPAALGADPNPERKIVKLRQKEHDGHSRRQKKIADH
ncbi:nucleoside 2-deoxyribosyltransferase [Mesorhizobium sp. M0243]|uniref:nucleoside 2-deoxyribosyltransferase n=1 Tax=Mesorhizobium sp. M0243 TaxID=2956925 RepID=UPI0033373B45